MQNTKMGTNKKILTKRSSIFQSLKRHLMVFFFSGLEQCPSEEEDCEMQLKAPEIKTSKWTFL